ncbi:hypothetical protein [Arhodomonas sp. AD133]|uniref:hypothetical protein n=1 Tax=Arhodomonas sp. AD133 TaxID=3415009 RepID=UPI003EB756DD
MVVQFARHFKVVFVNSRLHIGVDAGLGLLDQALVWSVHAQTNGSILQMNGLSTAGLGLDGSGAAMLVERFFKKTDGYEA